MTNTFTLLFFHLASDFEVHPCYSVYQYLIFFLLFLWIYVDAVTFEVVDISLTLLVPFAYAIGIFIMLIFEFFSLVKLYLLQYTSYPLRKIFKHKCLLSF